ncbi:MAG: TIGR02206 family membrane protein, partial [Acidobacteriota bacterium]
MIEAAPFEHFSAVHLWALGAVTAACFAFPGVARGRFEMPVRRMLAALIVAHLAFKTWLWIDVVGRPWNTMLPLHLCDIANVLCALLLVRGGQYLYELVYFWGLAGTLQALLTPDIPWTFPHPTFIAYFFGHGIIIVVAVFA